MMGGLRRVTVGLCALSLVFPVVFGAGMDSAQACGGTFCNNANQINQTAERIIFVDRPDGTVTAVVEIQYQGNAEDFSWVLPVPGTPDIGVSSALALDRLQRSTNPRYNQRSEVTGVCTAISDVDNNTANNDGNNDSNNDAGVVVVASGTAGPFDYEVISLDPQLDEPADVAVQWLEENGYEVTPQTPDLLGPYLEDGMNLIGFRLTNGAGVESIRPIMMTYETDDPMIPIRPTAVAANDDMGIMVFNVAPGRAVPANYRHLVLNEAAINWFVPSSNYRLVVERAADEAGGQGFVTELAAPTSNFSNTILTPNEFEEIAQYRLRVEAGSPVDIIEHSLSFLGWDGYMEALSQSWSGDGELEELLDCPQCFFNSFGNVIVGFDMAGFLALMENTVIGPMEKTHELLGSEAYLTRFFTTMSPFEMTTDPVFTVNPDLPDVSNVHTLTRMVMCDDDLSVDEAPWWADFDGVQVHGVGQRWPVRIGKLPANRRIEQLGASGPPEVVVDNTEEIRQELSELGLGAPTEQPETPDEGDEGDVGGGESASDAGGGCSAVSGSSPGGGALVLLLSLVALRLRRRGRFFV